MTSRRLLVALLAALFALFPVAGLAGEPGGALQERLERMAERGGGTARLAPGAVVEVAGGLVLPEGVRLDLNGGTIHARLDGRDIAGVRMLSDTALTNGTVRVSSRGRPGEQAGYHAAILVGALYGENRDARRPSRFEAPSNWRIEGITASSDKWLDRPGAGPIGAAAIQVVGGAHDGTIRDVTIPSSARMAGGVMLDWGVLGAIDSGNVRASAALHLAGEAHTSHPHDIAISDIRIGELSAAENGASGTFGVRLSGVHDVSLRRVRIASTSGAGVLHHAGDLGYRFALPAMRERAHSGIAIGSVRIGIADGYGFRSDSHADNLARAFDREDRRSSAIARSDMVVTGLSVRALTSGRGTGMRIDHQRGGTFTDLAFADLETALVIDEQVDDVAFSGVSAHGSTDAAFTIGHPHRPPSDIRLSRLAVTGESAGSRRGIVARSRGVHLSRIEGARIEVAPDAYDFARD